MSRLLPRVAQYSPGQVPVLAVYRLKHIKCGGYADSSAEQRAYKDWVAHFAQGVGSHPAVTSSSRTGSSPCPA